MQLDELKNNWVDTPEYHAHIHESFIENVNNNHELNIHRTWVSDHVWGFGERSFWWMWKLLCDNLPNDFSFLEVGVFKGATLSVIKLLRPDADIFGITPLDSTGIDWEDDYRQRIHDIFDKFNNSKYPHIFHGRSDDDKVVAAATMLKYDVVYLDGGHGRVDIDNDFKHYAKLVKANGYLVVDDACNDLKMPWGYFQGISDVTESTLDFIKKNKKDWDFITNIVHLRVYKRNG